MDLLSALVGFVAGAVVATALWETWRRDSAELLALLSSDPEPED